ncbi:MOSC domain-containing protein [Staphylococcus canis]|uniref:MOSC domain-containing protein n=1 Tax=Staphylococcus canis TaxID=2724942 RepID=A0ABS0T6P6_9STAP|nr:MOSC domain-containing protein [Staphylococcus canis]MBI5974408.1 MOSC domain-containing protein [Staphylococcus canis]
MAGTIEALMVGHVKHLGRPEAKDKLEQPWTTGAFKTKTDEAVWLTYDGLEGDAVADTRFHGGREKALFAFAVSRYPILSEQFGQEIQIGSNGENVAVNGMDETTVNIGDVYQIGTARVQVSQPRRPCWKPGRRLRLIEFGAHLQNTGYTGWYFRVLKEGMIQKGDTLQLLERPYPEWSIQRINQCLYHQTTMKDLELLYQAPFLPENWRLVIENKIKGIPSDDSQRLYGPNL